jgi:hypothetical protein
VVYGIRDRASFMQKSILQDQKNPPVENIVGHTPLRTKTLIRLRGECIPVKQEDMDWLVYHLIPPGASTTSQDLVRSSGLDPSVIDESLQRLERYCLIEQNSGKVRVLTFGESLIHNQVRYEKDLPFTIENGVIREKKK